MKRANIRKDRPGPAKLSGDRRNTRIETIEIPASRTDETPTFSWLRLALMRFYSR